MVWLAEVGDCISSVSMVWLAEVGDCISSVSMVEMSVSLFVICADCVESS